MISVYRGDSWPLVVTVKNATTGLPISISGYQFKLTVDRKANPATSPSTTKIFELSGVVTNGAAGQVTFTPSSVNHALAGEFFYDIQMTNSSNNIKTITKSTYSVLQDITK